MGIILRYKDFLKTYKTRSHRIRHLRNYKKLFPIKASPILAGVVADLICDGHLQADPKWRIDFTSKSIEELKRFEKNIFLLFKTNGRIRECKSNKLSKSYNLAVNCSPIARILYLCGTPPGQKVLTRFEIPVWVRKDKKCFKEFCRRFFTCEGGISYDGKRKIPQIRANIWKADHILKDGLDFVNSLCKLMNTYFNINSTTKLQKPRLNRKDGILTRPIRVYIFGESVILFFRKIGFEGQKQKNLKAILNSNFSGSIP